MKEYNNLHDDTDITVEPHDSPILHAGDLLRKQRETLGMSQKEVADHLRLRVSIIESIDKNEFDLGQVDTFVKGYLRSYAKAVNLNEDDVLAAYEQHFSSGPSDTSMQSFSRKTKKAKHDNNLTRVTYVIFAVILGISALWWWQSQQSASIDVETAPASEMLADESVSDTSVFEDAVIEPVEEEQPQVADANEPASPLIDREAQQQQAASIDNDAADEASTDSTELATSEAPVQEPVSEAEQPQATEPEQTANAPQDAASNSLFMNFTADCWIQVKDGSGKVLATGVKNAGETVTIEGQKPYSIVLGAPEGVEMRLASEPIDLSGYTAGKVARLTLP